MRMRAFIVPVLCLLCLLASGALAATYRWVDAQGKIHFSDTPPADQAAQELELQTPPVSDAPKTAKPVSKQRPAVPEAAVPKSYKAANVEIYMTDWCPYCRKAEAWFRARNVPFVAYDVEKDPAAAQRKAKLSRSRGVPLVMVCGRAIPGFSTKEFEDALDDCPDGGGR